METSRRGIALVLALLFAAPVTVALAATPVDVSHSRPQQAMVSGFFVPNDRFLSEQWYLFNFGQKVGGNQAGPRNVDVRAPEAWAITEGDASVVVAILDTGVDIDHPDIEPNVWMNPGESGASEGSNGMDDDGNGFVDDVHGWNFVDGSSDVSDERGDGQGGELPVAHGTSLASIVAAQGNNDVGMAGIAPGVTVMPVKVFSKSGAAPGALAEGARYAAANGAQIVNMSFGQLVPGFGQYDDVEQVIEDNPGILFVAAAMNAGWDQDRLLGLPCAFEQQNLLCVAATDHNDVLAEFFGGSSGYGATTVDIAAPGANMLVAQPPLEEVWAADFDRDLASWRTEGGWGLTSDFSHAGGSSVTDSPGGRYVEGATSAIETATAIDLSGKRDCRLAGWVRSDRAGVDRFSLLTSVGKGPFILRAGAGGLTMPADTEGKFVRFDIPLAQEQGDTVRMRFELVDHVDGRTAEGVWIDDLSVTCAGIEPSGEDYAYAEGTSYATPLTAGVAALLLSAHPELSPAEVKTAILEGGHPVPALSGRVASGARLDAYGALLAAGGMAAAQQQVGRTEPGVEADFSWQAPAGGLVSDSVLPDNPLVPPLSRDRESGAGVADDGDARQAAATADGGGESGATAAYWLLMSLATAGLLSMAVWRRLRLSSGFGMRRAEADLVEKEIQENAASREALTRSKDETVRLAERMEEAQAERTRLAREAMDELGQRYAEAAFERSKDERLRMLQSAYSRLNVAASTGQTFEDFSRSIEAASAKWEQQRRREEDQYRRTHVTGNDFVDDIAAQSAHGGGNAYGLRGLKGRLRDTTGAVGEAVADNWFYDLGAFRKLNEATQHNNLPRSP